MRILVATDKFKGTFTSAEAAAAIRDTILEMEPEWDVRTLPLGDGGEGTTRILVEFIGGTFHKVSAADPLFRQVTCNLGMSPDGQTAFIDSSDPVGLHRMQQDGPNPLKASSRGVGELIRAALQRRVKRIVVAVGGTATMDAGTGLLQALGVRFFNEDHQSLMPTGANLGKIENLKTDGFALANSKVEIIFLCDVDLPLLEENEGGGVMRFGGQKGLSPQDRPLMHAAFGNFRNLMEAKHHGKPKLPGMGAGGGMAFALSGLYPVRLEPGGKWVANAIGLDQSIHEADLVITGEGRLDSTTFNGKCVSVVADMAVRQDKPVVAIVGKNALKAEEWSELGLDSVYPLMPDGEHSGLEMSSSLAAIQTATRQFVLDHRLKLK